VENILPSPLKKVIWFLMKTCFSMLLSIPMSLTMTLDSRSSVKLKDLSHFTSIWLENAFLSPLIPFRSSSSIVWSENKRSRKSRSRIQPPNSGTSKFQFLPNSNSTTSLVRTCLKLHPIHKLILRFYIVH
jgi:hypothetical protein